MARRTRPPQSTPPPSDRGPSELSSWDEELPLGPGESRPDPVPEDLTESTAFVLMSGSVDGLPPGPGESRPDPVPEDLTESTAMVVMTASDDDRFDRSRSRSRGGGGKGGGGRKGGGGAGRARAEPPGPPRRGRSRWLWLSALALAVAWGVSLLGLQQALEVGHRRDREEAERGRAQVLAAATSVQREELEASRGEARARARELAALRQDMERERTARGELERALGLARDAARTERIAFDKERESTRRRAERATPRDEAARAARGRAALERRVRDTVRRYEALLVQARTTEARAVEAAQREALAELARREASLRRELESRRAALETEKADALEQQAAKIEARLRAELSASADPERGMLGGDDELSTGFPEGVDLEGEVWEHLRGHLSGSAAYRLFAHFRTSGPPDAKRARSEGRILLRYEVDPASWLTLRAAPRIHFDDDQLARGSQTQITDREVHRPIFSLDEAFAQASFGDVDLRLGKLIWAFGTADLFNPTDVLPPLDLTDLGDTRKLGTPALEVAWFLADGDVKLAAGWLPWFTPARLAPPGERFSPVPPALPIPFGGRKLPARTLENGSGFLRLETAIWDADVSITALVQRNPVPNLRLRLLPIPELTPVYDRRVVLGADLSRVFFDDWVVNVEVAEIVTMSDRDDDVLQVVVGVRRSFYPLDRELRLIVEYAGEWIQRRATDPQIVPSTFQRIFANALLGRVVLTPISDLDLQVTGALLLEGPDSIYLQPELRYTVTDHTRLTLGLDLFEGGRSSVFGEFGDQDRFYFALQLSF